VTETATIVTILLGGIGTLSSAVAYIYLLQRTDHDRLISMMQKKWEQCEEEKENMWRVIADMKNTTPSQLKREYGVANHTKD